MISKILKTKIEDYWKNLKRESPLYQKILAGDASSEEISQLIANTKFLITYTPTHLQMAINESAQVSNIPELQPYFKEHFEVEVDHDKWAEDDINLIRNMGKPVRESIVPSMRKLVDNIENIIRKDVVLYLSYILWAEYLCVVAASDLAHDCESKCQIPREALSVFTKHAELDQEHCGDDSIILDSITENYPHYSAKLVDVLDQTCHIYSDIWKEIAKAA